MEFDQDHNIVNYNDVKKDVAKLFIYPCERHQFAFLFLKDFKNDIHFVILDSSLSSTQTSFFQKLQKCYQFHDLITFFSAMVEHDIHFVI